MPEKLTEPLSWKKPRRIFVNSMSDLFHEDTPDEMIDQVFAVIARCERHTMQILTKRGDRMRRYYEGAPHKRIMALIDAAVGPNDVISYSDAWPLPNVWLGVSVEDQRRADERIPHLLATPAAVRFLSLEPLLEDLGAIDLTGISWVICGGESGPHARPMRPRWARNVRDQCVAAGVPFFFKQWGEWAPGDAFGMVQDGPIHDRFGGVQDWMNRYVVCADRADRLTAYSFTGHATDLVYRVGKKRAGALLDGREHREMPAAVSQ